MTDAVRNIDLIISTAGFVLSVISIVQALSNRDIERKTRSFFISFFSVISIYVLCILLRGLTHRYTGHGWAVFSYACFFGQAVLSAALTVLVTAFLLYQSGEKNWQRCAAFRVSALLWMIYVVMEIVNLGNGMLYSVDDMNAYSRGPYFALQMIPPLLIMLINLIALIRRKDRFSPRQKQAFALYVIIPSVCMLIQMRSLGVHLIELGTVIASLIMFGNIIADQREKYLMREAENAQLKMDILMAQIRPHFLFNSLTTIKYLISRDPKKADEGISSFMKYLRQNMDSLSSDRLISFKDELDHVKGYLELQKMRFGDELDVEYDIQCEDFMLPSLILAPLVENAVSYGIRRNEDRSGKVTIRSRRTPDGIELIVEDDGPGFVPDALPDDKERSHIGIKNVRERIEKITGGELRIESEIGKGTKATIILPQEKEQ